MANKETTKQVAPEQSLCLSESQLKELDAFINEMSTKYGMPLRIWLQQIAGAQAQAQRAQAESKADTAQVPVPEGTVSAEPRKRPVKS